MRHETRERVERAMRELLYVPPGAVRTGAIGLLVSELANPIFPALAQAMETQATNSGFATILCNIRGSTFAEAEYMQMLLERRVDGMIFISSEAADLRADHSHYARLLGQGRGSSSSTARWRRSMCRTSASTSARRVRSRPSI